MPTFIDRVKNGWNAFIGNEKTKYTYIDTGAGYSYRPDRRRLYARGSEKSIVNSIYNRLAIDVAATTIRHARVNQNGQMIEIKESGLDDCLNISANIDQTGRAFIQDIVQSMCDEGVVAVVPVETTANPMITGSYDILALRTGSVTEWFPKHVRVKLYNDNTGRREEITLPKSMVAIIENPLYSIMNEPNSTLQRLIRKLGLLDSIDEQSSQSKLDLIVQLPYSIKTKARQEQAEQRRKDIEMQLTSAKYGIAYIDSTEKVTQLNRSLENNLLQQIQYLTDQVFYQLGITNEVLNGTANEETMLNYYNRTIEPFLGAITTEFRRKFLTKTAISQSQSVIYYRDPFKLVPVSQIAEIADKFTRNEIASTNEMRAVIGWRPSDDPRADELRNKNLNQSPDAETPISVAEEDGYEGDYDEESYGDIPLDSF